MKVRHWYWIFLVVLYTSVLMKELDRQAFDSAFWMLLSLIFGSHALWALLADVPSPFDREFWEEF